MSDRSKYARYAQKVKIFDGLSLDEVSEIMRHGDTLRFRAGQTIFHKGQLGNSIFIVLQGTVDIENEGIIIGKCRVGDAFGEMSVLNHRPHCASAAAATAVKVFTIDETQIHKLLDELVGVRFLMNIVHVLSAHLETANGIIARQSRGEHGLLATAMKGAHASS